VFTIRELRSGDGATGGMEGWAGLRTELFASGQWRTGAKRVQEMDGASQVIRKRDGGIRGDGKGRRDSQCDWRVVVMMEPEWVEDFDLGRQRLRLG
jgi:hypothetical protein